jgi:hypothetical protein
MFLKLTKLDSGTMFTLFFAGDTFAPNRKVKRNLHRQWAQEENGEELIGLQEFLQGSMIEAFGQLADSLSRFNCVIGFEVSQTKNPPTLYTFLV